MYKKILIIANLKAGRAKMYKYINRLKTNLTKFNIEIEEKDTDLCQNATDILKNYEDSFDVIVVCGGDGTLNQVVEGLCELNKNVPLVYIPSGTTNDFAKSLGIPLNSLELSKHILEYKTKEYDIGKFNNRYFNYVASIGLFSKTSYETSFKMKNRFGRLAYIISGIKEFFTTKSCHLKIVCDDKIIDDDFMYGSVSNSEYIGGFKLFKEEKIELDDGIFECVFAKNSKSLLQKIKLFIKMINGKFNDENIYYFKASKIKIESLESMEWSIDGEYSGKVKNVEIINLNKQIQYLIPDKN